MDLINITDLKVKNERMKIMIQTCQDYSNCANETPRKQKNGLNIKVPELEIRLHEGEESRLPFRNQTYINNISPDSRCYNLNYWKDDEKVYQFLQYSKEHLTAKDKTDKKRNSYGSQDCYVFYTKEIKETDCSLPEGTKLFKPKKKLVALVAETIYDSPDGILQVQHIYSALQRKYPFFLFMRKDAISSWKSSIRHALSQKWFFKVKISNDQTYSKSSYWAVNTLATPKEWSMPSHISRTTGILAQADVLTALMLLNSYQKGNDQLLFAYEESLDLDKSNKKEDINYVQDLNCQSPCQIPKCPVTPQKSLVPKKVVSFTPQYTKEYDPVLFGMTPSKSRKRLDDFHLDVKDNASRVVSDQTLLQPDSKPHTLTSMDIITNPNNEEEIANFSLTTNCML